VARFVDQPIRRQIAIAIAAAMTVALVLAGVGLGAFQAWSARRALVARVATAADITARNSTAALVFGDEGTARDLLGALVQEPTVVAAATFDARQRIVATFVRDRASVTWPMAAGEPRAVFEGDRLVVVRPVAFDGSTVGWVFVSASTEELSRARTAGAMVVAVILVVAGCVVWLLVRPLLRIVAQPIVDLARSAQQVATRRDFTARVRRTAAGDVGALVDQYNAMLEELARQDLELRRHAESLEESVASRTADLRRANQALESARDRAEEASRAKSRFLANMSHELRTPMNGILGMTEIALDLSLAREPRECLQTIRTSATGLLHVINDVLDFSRLDAGTMRLDAQPLHVRSLVEQAVALVSVQARRKGLALEVEIESRVPATVVGDAGRIRQVLINLLGNAVKFTDVGRVAVRVSRAQDGDRPMLAFSVTDTGAGIAPEQQARIFEPFWQADDTFSRRHEGLGLGLSISLNLARLLGGSIHVASEFGRGSTFTLLVQLLEAEQAVPDRQPAPLLASRGTCYRVLVAEDNPVNQLVTRRLLRKRGHTPVVVANGREAVERLEQEAFDLVLMDVQMPEMDGLEATRAIRARERARGGHVPIVALTAHALDADRQRCLESGMDGYLSKPFTADALESELRRVLGALAAPAEPLGESGNPSTTSAVGEETPDAVEPAAGDRR
jgi:signal transduction histidine kinase/ActR/RegA family two-component response regulator